MKNRKTGTAAIIIDGLSRCMQTSDMLRISRAVAISLPYHVIQRRNCQHRVFQDKDDSRQYLGRLRDHTRRDFLNIWVYCPMSKNQ